MSVVGSAQRQSESSLGNQVYVDSAGASGASKMSSEGGRAAASLPPEPPTDMQRLAAASTGEALPIFGRDLFQSVPSTFAPSDQIPTLSDYIVGPGDVLLIRLWGLESFNGQLTVDNSGSIYIPQAGAVHVAGLTADQLQAHISAELQHTFRNFNLSVNLGHLRSIQVYVVGEARRPGAYTVSSLSTLLNVLFVAGGPNIRGSMRQIEVRRAGKVVSRFDLYDLLLRGDKTNDLRLQTNDTVFIPAVGPMVALGGSIRHPAIYELRGDTSVAEMIDLAGGFTEVGSSAQISLERIEASQMRTAINVTLDTGGRSLKLRNGDVLFAHHITTAFQQTVTIRGNLANPGRFPWHEGMRLSEIIPDKTSLLTNNYWQERNRLGVPAPLFQPFEAAPKAFDTAPGSSQSHRNTSSSASTQSSLNSSAMSAGVLAGQSTEAYEDGQDLSLIARGESMTNSAAGSLSGPISSSGNAQEMASSGTLADQQMAARRSFDSLGKRTTIHIPAPEINWSYAVIERLDTNTLKNSLVPFNLGKLVLDHDVSQDLELQPGDVVTILSQADISGPQDEQTKYVRLEGEFGGAGIYSVKPNETLDELVRRAGGLTSKAYLYGASFTRESARVFQQQRFDEYISTLAISLQRDAAVRSASAAASSTNQEQAMIEQLRKQRATGRIVLEFKPNSSSTNDIPHIPLEDGDVFRVSSRPLTVAVIGAVYGQNVFLFNPLHTVQDYLMLAGNPKATADIKHAFIIRADGSVFSRGRAQGAWRNNFDSTSVNPGDTIVVPDKPIRPTALKQVMEYSQLFSQFALGAAAISVIE